MTTAKKLTALRRKCDRLMQEVGKKKFPKSIVSGLPTQVMHHFHPKSTSSALRYDWDNLIPLTNGEHMRHHQANDPIIHGTVIRKRGMKWHDDLEKRRRKIIKVNLGYFREQLEMLEKEL